MLQKFHPHPVTYLISYSCSRMEEAVQDISTKDRTLLVCKMVCLLQGDMGSQRKESATDLVPSQVLPCSSLAALST